MNGASSATKIFKTDIIISLYKIKPFHNPDSFKVIKRI
jgi:hypothetical protein